MKIFLRFFFLIFYFLFILCFLLILNGYFSWGCGWQLFSWLCENICHVFPGLHGFWRGNHCHPSRFHHLWVRCYFSLAAFKTSSLSLVFKGLIMICLSMDFFGFILSGIYSAFSIYIWEVFIHYFFEFIFNSILFLLFWESDDTNVKCFLFTN